VENIARHKVLIYYSFLEIYFIEDENTVMWRGDNG
jgi:hypothetical protein